MGNSLHIELDHGYPWRTGDTCEVLTSLQYLTLWHLKIPATSPTAGSKNSESIHAEIFSWAVQLCSMLRDHCNPGPARWPLSPASGQGPASLLLLFQDRWKMKSPSAFFFCHPLWPGNKASVLPRLWRGSVQSRLFRKHSCYLCFLVSATVTPLCF